MDPTRLEALPEGSGCAPHRGPDSRRRLVPIRASAFRDAGTWNWVSFRIDRRTLIDDACDRCRRWILPGVRLAAAILLTLLAAWWIVSHHSPLRALVAGRHRGRPRPVSSTGPGSPGASEVAEVARAFQPDGEDLKTQEHDRALVLAGISTTCERRWRACAGSDVRRTTPFATASVADIEQMDHHRAVPRLRGASGHDAPGPKRTSTALLGDIAARQAPASRGGLDLAECRPRWSCWGIRCPVARRDQPGGKRLQVRWRPPQRRNWLLFGDGSRAENPAAEVSGSRARSSPTRQAERPTSRAPASGRRSSGTVDGSVTSHGLKAAAGLGLRIVDRIARQHATVS